MMSGVKARVTPLAAMKLQKAGALEVEHLQRVFASNRELGIWTSPYPQVGFSASLGCNVREIRAKDMVR